ncbi:MAG: DsbA family protein [Deltaproteobacteria bacterium]|nr:DsbA family protein [Deltaproteobacteria bacterium]
MKKFIIIGLLLTVVSCSRAKQPIVITNTPGESKVLAVIDGEKITEEDIKKSGSSRLAQASAELYEAQKDLVDAIVQEKLLAKEAAKRQKTADLLLKEEIFDKVAVTDKEIEQFYNEKKASFQGKTLDQVKENLKSYLQRQKQEERRGEFVKKLMAKVDLSYLIQPPRVEVGTNGNPGIGPKDAKITMIEFTDYQCPFCGRAREVVNQVIAEYKGKLHYVLRDFPLSFHKESFKAHESARCANDQGKYWEMNKKLFSNQRDLKLEDLQKYASELKLDMNKFNECLSSSKHAAAVSQDQQDGEKAGVSGTPAFFINGRMISGARPFAAFKEIIDEELGRN